MHKRGVVLLSYNCKKQEQVKQSFSSFFFFHRTGKTEAGRHERDIGVTKCYLQIFSAVFVLLNFVVFRKYKEIFSVPDYYRLN